MSLLTTKRHFIWTIFLYMYTPLNSYVDFCCERKTPSDKGENNASNKPLSSCMAWYGNENMPKEVKDER